MVERYAEEGAKVVVPDLYKAKRSEIDRAVDDSVVTIHSNFHSLDDSELAVNAAVDRFGRSMPLSAALAYLPSTLRCLYFSWEISKRVWKNCLVSVFSDTV